MIEVIIISDCVVPGSSADVLKKQHREMLDDLNNSAREARWPGLKFSFYGYDKKTGVIQIQALPGIMPGTMHLLKCVANELRAKGVIEQGGLA